MEIQSPSVAVNHSHPIPHQIEELHYLCCEGSVLLDLVTDAIVLWSVHGRVKFWNLSAEKIYGWRAGVAIGKQVTDFLHHCDDPQYHHASSQTIDRGEWAGQLNLSTRDGKSITVTSHWYLIVNAAGTAESILSIDSDITEHKLLEQQFLRAQRLENLGALASGIAHDLNNILTPIVAITELLPLKLTNLDERTQKLLKTLAENSRRGRELVAQILAFARGSNGEHTLLQPRHLLTEIVQVARQTFPKSIETSLQIESSNLWTVAADATQIHQVLMNLCINARDAMADGGELVIMAENIILSDEYPKLRPHGRGGAYVAISVADTGIGIPPELVDQIFEPFFTTKAIGEGTGLGLSTVATIVKNHHGFIDVSSQLGQGTQFRFYLPANEQPEIDCTLPNLPMLIGKGELVLIVDDEPSIREILSTTIEAYHYQSITASNSQQAIELYTQRHQEIRIVLLDCLMPGSNLNDTIDALQAIDSNLRMIVMSGLSAHEIVDRDCDKPQIFLAKPFSTQDLLYKLRSVLN